MQDVASPSGALTARPPPQRGDLEEGRPHRIISNIQRVQNEESSDLPEIQIFPIHFIPFI